MQTFTLPGAELELAEFELTEGDEPLRPLSRRSPRNPDGTFKPPSGRHKSRAGRPPKYRRLPHPIDPHVGSVYIDLGPIMAARGYVSSGFGRPPYPNLKALMRGAGISEHTAYALLRRPDTVHSVSLDVIARVCEFLQCQPGDWLSYAPRVTEGGRRTTPSR